MALRALQGRPAGDADACELVTACFPQRTEQQQQKRWVFALVTHINGTKNLTQSGNTQHRSDVICSTCLEDRGSLHQGLTSVGSMFAKYLRHLLTRGFIDLFLCGGYWREYTFENSLYFFCHELNLNLNEAA